MTESEQTVITEGGKCLCGQELPWHLHDLMQGGKHVCLCKRLFEFVPAGFQCIGTEENPFA